LQKIIADCAFKSGTKAEFDNQKQPKKSEINRPKPLSGPSQAVQNGYPGYFSGFLADFQPDF
jgi:hypothetical protein